jgi:hypothetical protein
VIVLRGYASQTLVDEVGEDVDEETDDVAEAAAIVLDTLGTDQRPSVLLTIGGFDASGDHLRALFVERTDCRDEVIKVGVTFDQARTLPRRQPRRPKPGLPASLSATGRASTVGSCMT